MRSAKPCCSSPHGVITSLASSPLLSRKAYGWCPTGSPNSTMAYQGYGRGVALEDLAALHRFALGDFAPDLTVILDLPVEIGLARAAARSAADRFERLDRDFHERLRQGFRQIAADNPTRCVLIDASGDPQTVHRAVLAAVEQRLGVAIAPHPSPLPAERGEGGTRVSGRVRGSERRNARRARAAGEPAARRPCERRARAAPAGRGGTAAARDPAERAARHRQGDARLSPRPLPARRRQASGEGGLGDRSREQRVPPGRIRRPCRSAHRRARL